MRCLCQTSILRGRNPRRTRLLVFRARPLRGSTHLSYWSGVTCVTAFRIPYIISRLSVWVDQARARMRIQPGRLGHVQALLLSLFFLVFAAVLPGKLPGSPLVHVVVDTLSTTYYMCNNYMVPGSKHTFSTTSFTSPLNATGGRARLDAPTRDRGLTGYTAQRCTVPCTYPYTSCTSSRPLPPRY